jgi:MFS family permease
MNRPQEGSSTASRTGTRGLQRYLITAVLVRLADEGARVGLVLLALERTKSAAVGGLLVAVLLVPQVVAAPAIGLLTDRARQPRWVLTISVAGFAASLAAVAFLLGRVPLPVVVAILLLGGCCGPSLTGGLTSQLPTLISESSLPRAFGAGFAHLQRIWHRRSRTSGRHRRCSQRRDSNVRARRRCSRRCARLGHPADSFASPFS